MQNRSAIDGLTARHVHIIGGFVCAAMVALAWFVGIGPTFAAQAEAAAQRDAIAEHEREASELRNQVVQVERLISRAVHEEQQSPLRLEPVGRINRRLAEVSELAAKIGLDVSVIQPGQRQTRPRFEIVPIRLQGAGSFRKAALFLDQMHETFPDMGVASVEVMSRPNDTQGLADFALMLVWYAAPGQATPQTAEVALP